VAFQRKKPAAIGVKAHFAGFIEPSLATPARSTTVFTKTSATDLREWLTPLVRKTQPYAKRIGHKSIWVEPKLLAEIEYRAKSAEGKVRHPLSRRAGGSLDGHLRSLVAVGRKALRQFLNNSDRASRADYAAVAGRTARARQRQRCRAEVEEPEVTVHSALSHNVGANLLQMGSVNTWSYGTIVRRCPSPASLTSSACGGVRSRSRQVPDPSRLNRSG
jgi:hypothetical protein